MTDRSLALGIPPPLPSEEDDLNKPKRREIVELGGTGYYVSLFSRTSLSTEQPTSPFLPSFEDEEVLSKVPFYIFDS